MLSLFLPLSHIHLSNDVLRSKESRGGDTVILLLVIGISDACDSMTHTSTSYSSHTTSVSEIYFLLDKYG